LEEPQVVATLKQDALGRVELVQCREGRAVRRVACGGALPLSGAVARLLLARERRALAALAGTAGVPRLVAAGDARTLLREYLPGVALCRAAELPRDFFARLEELVRALHARGVCHNDLHKEANVLVGLDGYPALVDFQLASLHPRGARSLAARAREDLRHVWKHRAHYARAGGGEELAAEVPPAAVPPRGLVAEAWRRLGKPLARALTGLPFLRARLVADEARRRAGDPWPRWSAPVGPRPG
jgi:RIO-like serine/threonine protein kinase